MANKKPRGRPARPMPHPIDADPEHVAEMVLQVPHKTIETLVKEAEKDNGAGTTG